MLREAGAMRGGDEAGVVPASSTARLERVYRDNVRRVYGYAHHRVGPDLASDIVADVFHAAALATRDGRIDEVTTPWLMVVARNKVADHWRRTYRDRARRLLHHPREEDLVSFPADWFEDPRRPAVLAALDRLRADQRALLVLHHVDGMTVAELADAGGRSVSATESALARARRAFRKLYRDDDVRHGRGGADA